MTAPFRRDPDHSYWLGARKLPGVTRVLDAAGASKYEGVPRSVLADRADFGTRVHLATWYDDEGDLDESTVTPDVLGCVVAWRKFRAEAKFEPSAAELAVYSEQYRYGGTLDRVGVFHGTISGLVDIKAVRTLQPATALQTAGYARAASEMGAFDAIERYAVQLFEDGTYKAQPYDDPADFSDFLCALRLWRRFRGTP